jgi:hypothetical protein
VTGAIQHACAAMEATARDLAGDSKATFGQLVKRLDLPKPLDTAAEKLWGYASNNARHGLEGQQVDTPEAELVVSVAVTVPSLIRIAFKIIVCFQRHDVPLIFILYR